jgi:hypothetical protein
MPLLNPTAEPHVTAGFERFSEYVAKKQIHAFPALTDRSQ